MSSPDGDARPRTLLQWVSTSNPFYVLSAGLFLFGLRVSFGDPERDMDPWALASGLAFYTLLLASAAVLLVRFARIWNDVRTVLLLVVLMFLATSVTFDELLIMNPGRGRLLNLFGLGFSVILSEMILRAIRLSLPLVFKLPFYLLLAVFFLYPIVLSVLPRDPRSELLQWSLFAFSTVAGSVFLLLLPAIRRGPEYLRGNGSPWPWPFYPWSLFVFLAVAVVGRSFLLCKSFHLLDGQDITETIFAPFFLVPFGFVLAVLLLELGLVSRHRPTQFVAMMSTVLLVILAGIGHRNGAVSMSFLDLVLTRTGATPLYLTLLGGVAFTMCAWLRGVRFASEVLTAALAAFAFLQPDTVSLSEWSLVRPEWLVAPVVLQAVLGLVRREAWRLIAVGGVAAAWLTGAIWRLYLILRAEVAGLDYLLVGLLLLPLAVLISIVKSGRLTRPSRREPDSAG